MPALYPSWIEIPASDLERATAFYREVFGLSETPHFSDPPAEIVLLLASDKSLRAPGVSLVRSPLHKAAGGGAVINFHVDTHAALDAALRKVVEFGGRLDQERVDMGDGTHYINLLDCEGNRIALSSYESLEGEDG